MVRISKIVTRMMGWILTRIIEKVTRIVSIVPRIARIITWMVIRRSR